MRRRDFNKVVVGSAVTWPLAARAQQPERMRRLGIVTAYAESDATPRSWVVALVQDLRELGWSAGDNIQIEYRWPGADVGHISSAAAELIGVRPDVIVATGPLR